MNHLTKTTASRYASPVTSKKGVIGIGLPLQFAAQSRNRTVCGFFVSGTVNGGLNVGAQARRFSLRELPGRPTRSGCRPDWSRSGSFTTATSEPTMHSITLCTSTIREQDGLFSLNDLHKAAGGDKAHQPSNFLRLDQTQALVTELNSSDVRSLKTITGRNGGTYACRELVIAYAAWISAAFHLKVIRVFLAQHEQTQQVPALPMQPQPSLMGRRFLVTLEDGQEYIKPLSLEHCVVTPDKIPSLIRSGSLGLNRQQLADIAKACIEQLGQRSDKETRNQKPLKTNKPNTQGKNMTAIIFDTETTGINEPVIVEAAWLKISDPYTLAVLERFERRYNPGKPIELGAMATHHITDTDVACCPEASTFELPEGTEYLIGHNVDFDWKAIGEPPVKRICTLALSRYLFPELDSHTQSAMMYHFLGAEARHYLKNAHSAGADVENCSTVFSFLLNKMSDQGLIKDDAGLTFGEIWEISETARIPTVMTFGKHKGTPIKDVPSDYKRWLLNQPDVDPYLVKALRGVAA
jgi:exodeoxyribonuclease X